jgi:hypothetical protein
VHSGPKTVLACLMPFTIAVRLALVLAVLAVPADALAASAVRTSSVTGRLVVPAGHASKISLHCPANTVAVNGAVTRRGGGVVLRRSMPAHDVGAWGFRVAAAGGSGSRSVSAMARCVGVRVPSGIAGARLKALTRHRLGIGLGAGQTATARLGCGRAWRATGYGFDAGASGDVRLRAAVPDSHGWRFTFENTGSSTAQAGVSARCLARKVVARGSAGTAEMHFRFAQRARGVILAPGSGTFRDACGGNRFSLATGFRPSPSGSVEIAGTSPMGRRGGHWTYRGASAADSVQSFLLCLSRTSRFR